MKKLFALMLACLMLLTLAACNQKDTNQPNATGSTGPVLPTFAESQNPVVSFTLALDQADGNARTLTANSNDDGSVCVTRIGQETKTIDYNESVFHGLTAKLEQSGLSAMHGQDTIQEGDQSASMDIVFADGTIWSVAIQGTVPDAFVQGFATMEAFVEEVLTTQPIEE